MRWLRIAPLVLLLPAACNGDNDGEDAAPGSELVGETSAVTAELLAPVRAVSIAEIEVGQTAARQAQRNDVRQYAATIATDHRALVAILDSVAQAKGTRLMVTREARDLDNAVRLAHSTTQNMTGFDYDATFVRAEIEAQRQVISRIDDQLLPDAMQPETQTLLRDIRTMVDAHMTRARQLLAALAQAPAPETVAPVTEAPRPRRVEPPPRPFVPTLPDSGRPPVTTGAPIPPIPITTSG